MATAPTEAPYEPFARALAQMVAANGTYCEIIATDGDKRRRCS